MSVPGFAYAVTKCDEGRACRLIPDPWHPEAAAERIEIVVSSLRWLHRQGLITCHAYVVMPDHLHLVFALRSGRALGGALASFQSFTARRLNRLDSLAGPFWQEGFYDHVVRGAEDLAAQVQYVLANPVRKGYVRNPDDWPFAEAYPDWNEPGDERDLHL